MSKYGYFDLHRHTEASSFDGLGRPHDLAKTAVELGYEALGVSDHGVTYSNVKHFQACKEEGIKPIMGCEVYFQPKFIKDRKYNHLCLFAKNELGYFNMNKIISCAEETKYYTSKVTIDYLKKYHEGVICSSACVAGPVSQAIIKNDFELAEKYMRTFKKIFKDDFYVEIQPYVLSDEGVQEHVNRELIKLAKKFNVKCIMTSDSHMGSEEDFSTYLKMHEMSRGKKEDESYDIKATYGERYMPSEEQIIRRFIKMHAEDYGKEKSKKMAIQMCKNLKEIADKVDDDILDNVPLSLPKLYGDNAFDVLLDKVREGLKRIGKQDDKVYKKRAKTELGIIKYHGFEDYFLIVADYINWAKESGIAVGPGRGSVCNSIIAYLLNITTTDSIRFNLDFGRFLRKDKKKLPDVDIDFAMNRRPEVVDYIMQKYNAAQISSYGLYKVDNLLNDLAKVCGLKASGDMTYSQKQANAQNLKDIKTFIKTYESPEGMKWDLMEKQSFYRGMNAQYDNIIVHFRKMFSKLRFIGTHAAGLVVSGNDLCNYAPVKLSKDKKTEEVHKAIALDMMDLESINAVKFDTLGLKTMEGLSDLRALTSKPNNWNIADTEYINDPKIYEQFGAGNTDGVFQFSSHSGKGILKEIQADCFEDVCAASAMNRPGPLQMGMPKIYADSKLDGEVLNNRFYKHTKETYGAIVYQEQVMTICREEAGMSPEDTDRVVKMMKMGEFNLEVMTGSKARVVNDRDTLREAFEGGCIKNGISEEDAEAMFSSMCVYTFNKGHCVGYSLISLEEMYYKVYYPTHYWSTKLKFSHGNEAEYGKFQSKAVASGELIFLPHVNYSSKTAIRTVDGTKIIQLGVETVKGIGPKAALFIEEERSKRPFRNLDDFIDRCRGRVVNKRAIEILKEQGAAEFNKKRYLSRVTKFNSALYTRSIGR